MNVTAVKIHWKNKKESDNVKGLVSITLDDELVISGIKVIKGGSGLFVSMPQTKTKSKNEDKYIDICFPITKDLRNKINDAVIDEFNK